MNYLLRLFSPLLQRAAIAVLLGSFERLAARLRQRIAPPAAGTIADEAPPRIDRQPPSPPPRTPDGGV